MKILHFADLHLGVETYGRVDPASGISSRLLDFLAAFDQLVDYALENRVDLVLFCGDAYKSREPSQTHQREFARRINRLASSDIPIFLLVGNHDLPNAIGKATTMEIFDTLAVKNVYISNRPDVFRIETKSGVIQIASLPWLRRSFLLSKEETRNLSFEQINQRMQQVLTNIITSHISKLDPAFPSILAAHVGVDTAKVGSERLMAIGQEHFLLSSNIANPGFDYIALGHIHKHQVLIESPPTVYAGSIEKVDFGEEGEEKGFYLVDIEPDSVTGNRRVLFNFHPVVGRPFLTISVSINEGDTDPMATVLNAVNQETIKDAVVRLKISMPVEIEGQLRDSEIRDIMKEAYYFTIAKDIRREARLRLGKTMAGEIPPLEALKTYLETNFPHERAKVLLEYGEKLMQGEEGDK